MNKFKYYTDALKKYAKFKGKANRSEFWYFVLFNFVISFIIGLIYKDLANLYSLAVFVPSIAIGARRLHDIGKSGWMQLVALIPIIGWIWLVVLFAKKGGSVVESEKTDREIESTEEEAPAPVVEEKKEYFSETPKEEANEVVEKTEE